MAATYAHLGRLEDAHTEAGAFMKVVPSFSIEKWAKTEPFIDSHDLQRYVEGLREAGLPE